jgi:hypothetical protein
MRLNMAELARQGPGISWSFPHAHICRLVELTQFTHTSMKKHQWSSYSSDTGERDKGSQMWVIEQTLRRSSAVLDSPERGLFWKKPRGHHNCIMIIETVCIETAMLNFLSC